MTPAEIKSARQRLGLTQRQFAEALGLRGGNARSYRRYEQGDRDIPGPVARLVTIYLDHGIPSSFDPRS